MLLFVISYLAGVLTIISPCILPVLPVVLTRADKPFVRSGLPFLAGMAVAFTAVASLAAVAGGWVVAANQWGRIVALVALAVFGVALLVPAVGDWLTRPAVALGGRLSAVVGPQGTPWSSALLGVAAGLLWAPCAGPVLGLILTGAALEGASVGTSVLLLGYAAGAATSLAVVLLAGGKVMGWLKRSLGAGVWVRRGIGLTVLVSVVAIGLGLDTGLLARLSVGGTTTVEQGLMDALGAGDTEPGGSAMQGPAMEGPAMQGPAMSGPESTGQAAGPSLSSLVEATGWLNSDPLDAAALQGKVVLIDFWTYSCVNCLRTLPYTEAWAEKYAADGLVVIGVHSPEFAFERDLGNLTKAVSDLGVNYPVAIDNNFAIWRAFSNRYWPAHYLFDANGQLRHQQFGEGGQDESERAIQELLAETGATVDSGLAEVDATGAAAAAESSGVESPETYLGYSRAENFASPGGIVRDAATDYAVGVLDPDQWALSGTWTVGTESATAGSAGGTVTVRFRARDVNMVLGAPAGAPVEFRVTVDGRPPGDAHGVDADADGVGTVEGQRMYQLVRGSEAGEHVFEIEFLDAGVQAYTFTFG